MALTLQRARREEQMLNGSIPLVILKQALPTILAYLISSIYQLADTYFVSTLGTNAVAAVTVNSSLDMVIMMTGSVFATGACSVISRLLGAQEKSRASKALSTSFFIVAAFGITVLVLGTLFMRPLVHLLGATPSCEQYSVDYATYVLLAAPFMATSFVMNQCLRGEGSATLSMIGMGFGGVLNCFLDPLFIIKLGMGVAGASIATAISKFISFCILIYPYLFKHSLLDLSIKNFHIEKKMMSDIISIGSTALFRTALSIVCAIVLNHIAGGFSDSALAAVGVSNKIMMFPFGIFLGFGGGFQPVAGYNWGAKNFDRVRKSYKFSARTALIAGSVIAVLFFIFSDKLILLFTESDEELMRYGMLCIRLQSIAMPVHAWVAVVNMYCISLGLAKGGVLLSTARQGTCLLPFIHLFAHLFGVYGILSIQAFADALTMFIAIPVLLKVQKRLREVEESSNRLVS